MEKENKFQVTNNCISLVKILAALQVMYGHIIAHLQISSNEDSILSRFISYYHGVPIFFIISGFLIWISMERTQSLKSFTKKRFFRLFPELWLAVVIEIISIVLLANNYIIIDLIVFFFTQGTILQFWTPDCLRDYGCGTPNGTLWTISITIQFYVIAWLIKKVYKNRQYIFWIISFVALVLISIIVNVVIETYFPKIFLDLYNTSIIRYGWLFFFGCFLANFKEQIIPQLIKNWHILLILGFILHLVNVDINARYPVIKSIILVSGLIGFAYKFPQLKIHEDISYGIFLYHMIIVNIFISFGWIKEWKYVVLVFIITIIFAYISTILSKKIFNPRNKRV
ncbi:MAG: acyltransferase [Ruminococcus sp.]|uniref:acyltransferase family protein n=1 Tax=Ruminococcus sp. TaxID=41978 RepID=UPI0025DB383F|nr:acyltransferase [Ruminococcus sp.]MCR5540822.1 acyltransferase [Ruminococcus sp.]